MAVNNRFLASDAPLAGLRIVKRKPIGDTRGWLERIFCAEELRQDGWSGCIAQINRTLTSVRGTVRGMHFQYPPHAEKKYVSCLRGEVFDVAVDIRVDSPTFLHWHAEVLSAENRTSLLIPEGFAHGFQALSEDVEMLYLHSAPYVPSSEAGLNPQDPRLGIVWPLPITAVSERDLGHALIDARFQGVCP